MHITTPFVSAPRRARWAQRICAALVTSLGFFTLAACGGSGDDDVDRGPTTIEVQAKLNGLYWDASAAKLYLTDDDVAANAIKVWDGKNQFTVAYPLPAMQPEQRPTLGQLTRAGDGKLYVTRFGFGSYGTVVAAPPAGQPYNLTGLAGDRRRLPLTPTADGKLLTGWFRGGGSGPSGVISEITLGTGTQASERELITGLGKPAGLVVRGDQVIVSDQGSGKILAYSLAAIRAQPSTAADGRLVAQFTSADSLDLMTSGADGTLYFGTGTGSLYAVDSQGGFKTLATGWPGIRGVAVDNANRRLFAAVGAVQADGPSSIRIVPLD